MRNRALWWSLWLWKGCIGGWFLSSTITIPAVWCIGVVANVRSKATRPLTFDSASLTTKIIATMWDCIQQSTKSGYPDSSPSRAALYQFLVAYALSTLWTQCNEPFELHARHIEQTSPALLLQCTKCILHCSDNRILIEIDKVCEVSKSLETPSNLIL